MALDTISRPQQPSMHFMSHGPLPPQFTNPWVSQEQLNDAASNLHALSRPSSTTLRSTANGNSSPARNSLPSSDHLRHPVTSATAATTLASSSPVHYSSSSRMMNNVEFVGNHNYTNAELSMACSAASSPTTSSTTNTGFTSSFTPQFELTPPRSIIPSDRRLSQPAMPSSMFLSTDQLMKRRQASLTDMAYRPPRSGLEFTSNSSGTIRNVMLGQHQQHHQQQHQQQQQLQHQDVRARHNSTSSNYQAPHSTSSSISSNHSFPYYNGGSVDSSSTDYSDGSGFPQERAGSLRHQQSLSKPLTYVHTGVTVPNQMMTTFSSKITSTAQKKHRCKVCDKRFTRPSSLQTHTYSHTGEKPFACEQDGCGRRFSVVSNLRRHKKVHQGKKSSEL